MKLTNIVIKGNIINDILSNGDVQDQIEKYAREKYYMKRDSEDIYIIEFEGDSIKDEQTKSKSL